MDKADARASRTNSYAGTWVKYVRTWFYGGSSNGRLAVNVDKHTKLGVYATSDKCHGKFTASSP